jgi:7-cyano-7-deazaguanine synthase
MDSATLVGYSISNEYKVQCVNFKYGSKHNKYEIECAKKINNYYNLPTLIEIDLTAAFNNIESNLLLSGGDIPEGHYNDENMKLTVVPGRNTIFASFLYGIAESIGYTHIGLGVHKGDHHIYLDCRDIYIDSLNNTIQLASDNKVSIFAPFLQFDKYSILSLGTKHKVPYHLTRTCYKDQKNSCGSCGSCVERLEAFTKMGIKDPIIYETQKNKYTVIQNLRIGENFVNKYLTCNICNCTTTRYIKYDGVMICKGCLSKMIIALDHDLINECKDTRHALTM